MAFRSGALVSLILLCAATSFAQSLGDIARQERERKKEQPPRATYVYTDEDLKKEHILVPEDQARVLAARRNASTPPVEASQSPSAAPAPPVAISTASVSVPSVSAPAAPASTIPASQAPMAGSIAAVIPAPVNLEAPRERRSDAGTLVQKQISAGSVPFQAALPTQPVIGTVRSDTRLSSTAGKKSIHPRVATSVVSHSDNSAPRPNRPVLERVPADSDTAEVITVEPGDSLWKLAKRYLGRGSRWRELAELNTQITNASVIHAGEWICLPARDIQTARQMTTPHAHAPGSSSRVQAQTRASMPVTSPWPSFTAQISDRHRLAEP
jgi:nucleoid-associated protein YgaU